MENKNKDCGCGGVKKVLNKKDADALVAKVDGYTSAEHNRKEAEVNAAFAHRPSDTHSRRADHRPNHAQKDEKKGGGCL